MSGEQNGEMPAEPESAAKPTPWLNVVLVHPEIPPNTGAVGRTCVALGAKLWLVRPLGFRTDEKTLRRAGLDYWKHLDWEVLPGLESCEQRIDPRRVWLFETRSQQRYTDVSFAEGDWLLFGSESRGLPESWLERFADRRVMVPMGPHVRSLNLSCTVALAGYEAARQLSRFPIE